MLPRQRPSDIERSLWRDSDIPRNLVGKVLVNESELKSLFPENSDYNSAELLEEVIGIEGIGYKIYGRKMKPSNYPFRLAYGCNKCEKIVIGSPMFSDDESINAGHPLSGRLGYDIYCENCHAHIDGVTMGMS